MAAAACLNAGLLIGAEDKLVVVQRPVVPDAVIEVEDASRLGRKLGVTGENPAAMLPRADRFGVKPAPDGPAAEGRHQAGLTDLAGDLGATPARQGHTELGR